MPVSPWLLTKTIKPAQATKSDRFLNNIMEPINTIWIFFRIFGADGSFSRLEPHRCLVREELTARVPMRFKTCFKRNLSLFKRIIGPGTVMSKAGSVNPLRSSSVVSWPFCSEF